VNAAILIVAAAVFHRRAFRCRGDFQDAYKLLSPLLGAAGASTLSRGLLAAGELVDHRYAGRTVVMEGFIHLKVSPWMRRLITGRLGLSYIIVVPLRRAGTEKLLILSQ